MVVFLVCSSFLTASAVHSQATSDTSDCWSDYADCARQSSGDESWRSICYAHFTECLGRKTLSACRSNGETALCVEYFEECSALTEADPDWLAQCSADKDACEMAQGC